MEKMTGTLYGIGVGCGNPSDITAHATRILNTCNVIVFPSGKRAYDIVKGAIPDIDSKKLKFFSFPMTHNADMLSERRKEIYEYAKTYLTDGKSVGFVTIGDVLIYSTFSYIKELADRDGFPVEIVSGIPSFMSCAAKLRLVLGQDGEEIHIIPGSADIDTALALPGIKIFMKLGKHLPELKNALARKPEHDFLGAVIRCGMPDEKVITEISEVSQEKSYLMTAFIR